MEYVIINTQLVNNKQTYNIVRIPYTPKHKPNGRCAKPKNCGRYELSSSQLEYYEYIHESHEADESHKSEHP